jgi:hypothetical protein
LEAWNIIPYPPQDFDVRLVYLIRGAEFKYFAVLGIFSFVPKFELQSPNGIETWFHGTPEKKISFNPIPSFYLLLPPSTVLDPSASSFLLPPPSQSKH